MSMEERGLDCLYLSGVLNSLGINCTPGSTVVKNAVLTAGRSAETEDPSYEGRLGDALSESRADFESGRCCDSRSELAAAVAAKREMLASSGSDDCARLDAEDEIDLGLWHEAKAEFDADPVTYSAEEIARKFMR